MDRVIVLVGPTGVGKTAASLLLAGSIGGEIVSADSMQVYRHMDIGTAKPTLEERNAVPHHMIDIVDPAQTYNCGRYAAEVSLVIEDITRRGKVPLLVGGSGLYLRAVTRGLFSAPEADWQLRQKLLAMEQDRKGALYEYLESIDTKAARRIMPSDLRRIVRSLEVCIRSDDSITRMQQETTTPLPYRFLKIGLTRDRQELYAMINERVEAMMAAGLVDEVRELLRHEVSHTPLQAIGYKEIATFLQGGCTLQEAVASIKQATRRYAKRQVSWFKSEKDIRWVDITGLRDSEKIFAQISKALQEMS